MGYIYAIFELVSSLLITFFLKFYIPFKNIVDVILQFSTYKQSLAALNSFLCSAGFLLDIGVHLRKIDLGKVD